MLLTELYQLVPIIRFRVRRNKDSWMRIREVIVARSLRNRAYRVFRDSGMEDDRIIYCRLRNKLKSLIRKYKRLHYIKIFDGADSKKVWKILNNAGYGNRNLSINSEIDVNALNRSFVVNNNNNTNASDFESLSGLTDGFSFKHIYSDELLYALSKVKSNSIGTDGFPIRFIKLVFPCIIQPVLHLFNMVITTSTYPNQWKLSRVVPVPKSNSNSDFRPISILPALSKVMEHVLKAQLLNYIYQNNLISDVQYAYKTGHNTTGMLLGITETIRDYLNRDMNCVMVSLDLSKAFDRLDHSVLICKLREKFKLSVMACKLLNSYLQGRSQYVGVQDIYSDIVDITCGVPQGSIIGPILFLLYMNDCIDCFDLDLVRPFIFADDIQLLFGYPREFPDVLEAVIKCTLDKLLVWMGQNFFVINADKTKAIMFRTARRDYTYPKIELCNKQIDYVDSIKCLGVVMDQFLKFDEQVDIVSSRLTLGLRKLYHSGLYLPMKVKFTLAHALLMSHVNYCIEVYTGANAQILNRIFRVVKKIVRFVYSIRYYEHISNAISNFLSCSFKQYLQLRNLIYFYKIIKYGIPTYLHSRFIFSRSTRNPQVIIPHITCSIFERSFIVRSARYWNILPKELKVFSFSCKLFKKHLLYNFCNQ